MKKLILTILATATLLHAEWSDETIINYQNVEYIIAEASETYDVPFELLVALLYTESRFKPNAKSPTGALGIAQFTRATAKRFKVNRYDVESSIHGAARLLRYHFDNSITSFTDEERWNLACIYYNRGKGYHFKAKRALRKKGITITYNALIKQYKRYRYMHEGLAYYKAINKQSAILLA